MSHSGKNYTVPLSCRKELPGTELPKNTLTAIYILVTTVASITFRLATIATTTCHGECAGAGSAWYWKNC